MIFTFQYLELNLTFLTKKAPDHYYTLLELGA